MEKITYLLGAGASANALPLIKASKDGKAGLPLALENFVHEFSYFVSKLESKYVAIVNDIIKKCKAFGTPDLAAKFYLETKALENYRVLKALLSSYFNNAENSGDKTGNGFEGLRLDNRVIPFLTTISNGGKLPKEVRIISWNYDTQIEIGAKKLHPAEGKSNDFAENFHVWPFQAKETDRTDKDYFLLHLNGIAGYLYSERELAVGNPYPFEFNRPLETLLSFAWEDDESFGKETFTERKLELAKRMIEGTTILVVIGYSFPFFNRKVDAKLFDAMKTTLRKIYFQDPVLDGQFLYSQFGLLKDNANYLAESRRRVVEIISLKDVSQYYVPFEL